MKKEKLQQAMQKLIMEITTSNYMAIKYITEKIWTYS